MERSPVNQKSSKADSLEYLRPIHELIQLVETLRGENGCPWDRKQTPQSMTIHLIEEVYELIEAMTSGKVQEVCEELGDVLFHLVFIASLYSQAGGFNLLQAARGITEKMKHRHPHIFGDSSAPTVEDVKKQWKKIKAAEKKSDGPRSILDSVPETLPALLRAYKISERAAGAGFDWDTLKGVMRQTEEEWDEFNQALRQESQQAVSLEFGDILFTLTNVARFAGIHPETALRDSVRKFEKRFRMMENILNEQEKTIAEASRSELDSLWNQVKKAVD